MGKKALEPITESMFYVLMCLHNRNMYGTEIADLVRKSPKTGSNSDRELCMRSFQHLKQKA